MKKIKMILLLVLSLMLVFSSTTIAIAGNVQSDSLPQVDFEVEMTYLYNGAEGRVYEGVVSFETEDGIGSRFFQDFVIRTVVAPGGSSVSVTFINRSARVLTSITGTLELFDSGASSLGRANMFVETPMLPLATRGPKIVWPPFGGQIEGGLFNMRIVEHSGGVTNGTLFFSR